MVFAFELHGQVIGTIRMMPTRYGLTLTEQLLERVNPDFRSVWPDSWEAGRLVVSPEFRVGQDVLKRCLYLTLEQLMETIEVDHMLGSCTHVLSRLYRRFGFTIQAQNVLLPGTEKSYTLIHGRAQNVLAALAPVHQELVA